MWKDPGDDEALWEALYRLSDLDKVPEFTREFYGLLVEWAEDAEEEPVTSLLLRLLELDVRYYRERERLEYSSPPAPSGGEAEERRRIGLEVLYDQALSCGVRSDPSAEIVRQLLLAECAFYLERHEAVVAHLESAVGTGATDPLLYFALGHARFMLALNCYIRLELPGGEFVLANEDVVRQVCLGAVTAFQGALTGGPRDTEVLWWIGRVLLTAGYEDTARRLFAQAEASSEHAEAPAPEWDHLAGDRERQRRAPITDQEFAQFVEAIKESHPISALL